MEHNTSTAGRYYQEGVAMVLIVRHAERQPVSLGSDDHVPEMFLVDPKEVNEVDPPITRLGVAQARRTGEYIKGMLLEHGLFQQENI